MMMHLLPVPICRIVYRYLYGMVIEQLLQSYGRTLVLKSHIDNDCKRIRTDCVASHLQDSYRVCSVRMWRFKYSGIIKIPSNPADVVSYPSWRLHSLFSDNAN